jgi:predicted DNA-binding WGR domain protein
MSDTVKTLSSILSESRGIPLPVTDILHVMLPLMRSVSALHSKGLVAQLTPDAIIETDDGSFALGKPEGQPRSDNSSEIRRIQPPPKSALKIVGEYRVTVDTVSGESIEDLSTSDKDAKSITKPVYLPDFRAWEIEASHHDEVTDVFSLGLVLASVACGLDLRDQKDVERFSANKSNLFKLNRSLNPVIASLISEMTALNRHDRATNVNDLAQRLETYRDQPVGIDIERVLQETSGVPKRRIAVLAHLRDRLFDISRRNKLVYFRPTQASVNLTVASVPIVLRLEAIRPDQLCTWNKSFSTQVLTGSKTQLSKWLRFDDQPYLPSALDRIIQESRRDRSEYGFNNLRLVTAFLHWHNLKEAPEERISSPLLWLPVEVAKVKGVKDQYTLVCADSEAEFNPALRHHLKQLYGIQLPSSVDLNTVALEDIHRDLIAQIQASEPGVKLKLQDKPIVQLVHQKAVQRLKQFQKRRKLQQQNESIDATDFSYATDDFRPLGLTLFQKYVLPSPLPQRIASGGDFAERIQFVASHEAAERSTYQLGQKDSHRFEWEMDLTQVTLANFNYKKMSLVRDYNQLAESNLEQPAFDQVFSIDPKPFNTETAQPLPKTEQWPVVAVDRTQNQAIATARSGKSFIIQGPPGTGKSQTITNLIADFVARRKRVLFVCEKRAAIDVVFHRLKQAGLDRLACLVHDSQEDKKEFIQDLKKGYESWGETQSQYQQRLQARTETLKSLGVSLEKIERFETKMSEINDARSMSLRETLRRATNLPDVSASLATSEIETLPTIEEWDHNHEPMMLAAREVSKALGVSSLSKTPFSRLALENSVSNPTYADTERFVSQATRLAEELSRQLDDVGQTALSQLTFEELLAFTTLSCDMVVTGLSKNLNLCADGSEHSLVFQAVCKKLEDLQNKHTERHAAIQNWLRPFESADTKAALELARKNEGRFLSFLSGAWRGLKRRVFEAYDFSKHPVKPSIISILEKLEVFQDIDAVYQSELKTQSSKLGTADFWRFKQARDVFLELASRSKIARSLLNSVDGPTTLQLASSSHTKVAHLNALLQTSYTHYSHLTLDKLGAELRELQEGIDDLPDLLPHLQVLASLKPSVKQAFRTLQLTPGQIGGAVVRHAITRAVRETPELKQFGIDQLLSLSRTIETNVSHLKSKNANAILANIHQGFLDNVKTTSLSVTQLDSDGKRFKKRYSTGRRELEHEFGKTMRYRSIRDLSGDDTGLVVNDLKPIWLMSPLSVSDTLPLQSDLFDVVIFDEASQIPTEEAVPAMCRARQVIVVGDEMQLPPTTFFSSSLDEDEMQVVAEEEGEKISIILDADSLLSQAARNLPASLLAWHYRSRSESLINFSNAAFYNGRLVTIPDNRVPVRQTSSEAHNSRQESSHKDGAERVLNIPISYHHISDGVYEKQTNPAEARYIAGLLRELFRASTKRSIGIVAFSEAQQQSIESALEGLAERDSEFAARLEEEYVREDDNQFNGLFIKNLENVQGDERDIIILSICYAPDASGRMLMNFGPINNRGGEKRLNVIFSRAKHHMAVVSTIMPEAITNTHNDGARALQGFLKFALSQSRGDVELGQTILASMQSSVDKVFSANQNDTLRTQIAQALRKRGHEVDESVGSAAFRCDLAIRKPKSRNFELGILIDSGAYGGTDGVIERFVFRPKILRDFGWKVVDVPSLEWHREPELVLNRIEAALLAEADLAEVSTVDEVQGFEEPQAAYEPPPAQTDSVSLQFEEFRFKQGTSDKFWKIAVAGNEVTVAYGRFGSKGNVLVKNYDTAERAQREAQKLKAEKIDKGYLKI